MIKWLTNFVIALIIAIVVAVGLWLIKAGLNWVANNGHPALAIVLFFIAMGVIGACIFTWG